MTIHKPCQICHEGLIFDQISHSDGEWQYSCTNCGNYSLTRTLGHELVRRPAWLDARASRVLSHAIRSNQRDNEHVQLTSYSVKEILKRDYLPNPAVQAELFLLFVGDHQASLGQFVTVQPERHLALIGASLESDVVFIEQSLEAENLIIRDQEVSGALEIQLSMSGWRRYQELKRGRAEGETAFMAMKFNDDELNIVYSRVFQPAVQQAGFNLERLDESPRAGLIDIHMRDKITRSRLLIADLTHGNAGAYWEAGFAEGLNKPVVYTCKQSEFRNAHFDVNHSYHVLWDPNNLGAAGEELAAVVRLSTA